MEWSESIRIDAPVDRVRAAVLEGEQLLQWSAWPEATGYTCRIEGDGRSIGSAIVFSDDKGVEQGRQVLTAADDHEVAFRLRNRGPGGREMTPHVRFRFDDIDGARTRVHLDFHATVPLPPGPRHLVEAVMGRRVHRLHIKDLHNLKEHVETRTAN